MSFVIKIINEGGPSQITISEDEVLKGLNESEIQNLYFSKLPNGRMTETDCSSSVAAFSAWARGIQRGRLNEINEA